MKYTLAVIALLGLNVESSQAIQVQKKHHHHHHNDELVMQEPATTSASPAPAPASKTADVEAAGAAALAGDAKPKAEAAPSADGKDKEVKKTGIEIHEEETIAKYDAKQAAVAEDIKKSEHSGETALRNAAIGQEKLLKQIEASHGGPEKPVVEKKDNLAAITPAEGTPAKDAPTGNGGDWTLNMPEDIQKGGAGKKHWSVTKKTLVNGGEEEPKKEDKKEDAPAKEEEPKKEAAADADAKKEPEAAKADAAKPEAAKPDAAKPEAAKSDAAKPAEAAAEPKKEETADKPPADKEAQQIEAELDAEDPHNESDSDSSDDEE